MTSYPFKGIKIITKAQHEELLNFGYYTLSDGTQVQEDGGYLYASNDDE